MVAYLYWSVTPVFHLRVHEFQVDEEVEVLLDKDLVACGVPRLGAEIFALFVVLAVF